MSGFIALCWIGFKIKDFYWSIHPEHNQRVEAGGSVFFSILGKLIPTNTLDNPVYRVENIKYSF